MSETESKPAEFQDDDHRDAILRALDTEATSLDQQAQMPTLTDAQRATRARRADEARAEAARIRGGAEQRRPRRS